MEESYVCPDCGELHPGLPTDWGYQLPDDVFALSYLDRYRRTRANADLCCLDERRWFLRGVLALPFIDREGDFGLGVWVEVAEAVHDAYIAHFDDEHAGPAPVPGLLANDVAGYPALRGEAVEVRFPGHHSRPTFVLPDTATHPLAVEQREGIDRERHHALLQAFGFFDDQTRH